MRTRETSIEEILDEIDLELLIKYNPADAYPFPAIHIGNQAVTMNRHCIYHFTNLGGVKIFSTPEYIVMLPAKKKEKNAFSLRYDGQCLRFNIPVSLKEKCVKPGSYKAYKYKNGLCLKRYECLDDFGREIRQ